MARQAGQRLRETVMPKRFDGTGVVRFQCSEGVFNRMKMSQMPTPADWGTVDGDYLFVQPFPRRMPADSRRYRVVWPERSSGKGTTYATSSFSLGSTHTNQTLFVLAAFLREQGVEFICFADKNGRKFSAAGLQGGAVIKVGQKVRS